MHKHSYIEKKYSYVVFGDLLLYSICSANKYKFKSQENIFNYNLQNLNDS